MLFKIGFTASDHSERDASAARTALQTAQMTPRKSVVEIYFAERNRTLSYYNDRFDLSRGDIVYVDGKLEGLRGIVTEVNYNFRIKLSDYQRVIAVADRSVSGQFFMAGSHFITFDRAAVPIEKVATWFMPPTKPEDEFVSGSDDTAFRPDDLGSMHVSAAIAERGQDYYQRNRVRYLCIDGEKGYAIVEGSTAYEVAFEYRGGAVSSLTCSCFCSYNCKHEFAVMLQLRELLDFIAKRYAAEYERSEYFAAVSQDTLFTFAVEGRETGSITF